MSLAKIIAYKMLKWTLNKTLYFQYGGGGGGGRVGCFVLNTFPIFEW